MMMKYITTNEMMTMNTSMNKDILLPYTSLLGKHQGEAAFICGAGPSLCDCMSNDLFKKINEHVVVSVNSSILAMSWESGDPQKRYWVSNDALCRRWNYWQIVKKSKAIKVVRDSWEKYHKEIPGFLYFSPRPTSEDVIDSGDIGLAYCSSVPTSIDLCIQMGIKKIFLLGVDHKRRDSKTHFWQFWDYDKRAKGPISSYAQQKKVFVDYNLMAFEALNGFAKEYKSEIYNCNVDSAVDIFNKISFEEAFDIIGEDDES
jgi:hypothetical protein